MTERTPQMGDSPADDHQIDDDMRALVMGESMPEETAWAILATVERRAKREEREQLRDRVAAQMPEHGRHINMTAYREGLIDGVNRALRVLEATDA